MSQPSRNVSPKSRRGRGEIIRTLRSNKGWTQDDVSRLASCSKKTIENLEASKPALLSTLLSVAEVFQVAVEDISDPLVDGIVRPLMPPPAPATRPAAPAPHCYGREDELGLLVSALAGGGESRVAVYGPPGVGKGTLVLAALNEAVVSAQFRKRRYWIECESTRRYSEVLRSLADAVGVPPSANLFSLREEVLFELGSTPSVLVFDNAEVPIHGANPDLVEHLLTDLAALPQLALLVAYRGNRLPPCAVSWTTSIKLLPLPRHTAREMFLSITKGRFAEDPRLSAFLDAMEGLPLAIKLLAHRSTLESDLDQLWRLWQHKGTAILDRAGGDERTRSLAASLALSIDSEWIEPEHRTLLSSIAFLPDGMPRHWLQRPGLNQLENALGRVVQLGLVEERGGGWLRMLGPIREYVVEHLPATEDQYDRLSAVVSGIAQHNCTKIGAHDGRAAVSRLRRVVRNVEKAIRYRMNLKDRRWFDGALSAHRFTAAIALAGLGDPSLIDEAYERTRIEVDRNPEAVAYRLLLAQLRQSQGRIAESIGNVDKASDAYSEAMSIATSIDAGKAAPVVAKLHQDLADVALAQGHLPRAEHHFGVASEMFEKLPVGFKRQRLNCDIGRATVEIRRGRPQVARKVLDAVLQIVKSAASNSSEVSLKRVEAKCYDAQAEALMALGNDHLAIGAAIKALMEFFPTGDLWGSSICIQRIVEIVAESPRRSQLLERYIRAFTMAHRDGRPNIGQPLTFGYMHLNVAKTRDNAMHRELHLDLAGQFFAAAGRADMVDHLKQLRAIQL